MVVRVIGKSIFVKLEGRWIKRHKKLIATCSRNSREDVYCFDLTSWALSKLKFNHNA